MSKTIIFLIFLTHFCFSQNGSDDIHFYPLNIGNIWQYKEYHGNVFLTYYVNKEIIGDTLIESTGKKYYKIYYTYDRNFSPYFKYERIDTSSFLVYEYIEEDQERVAHNLKAVIGDTLWPNLGSNYGGNWVCYAIDSSSVLNLPSVSKKFEYHLTTDFYYYYLTKYLGYSYYYYGDVGVSISKTLIYAKIDNKEYGQLITTIPNNGKQLSSHILLSNYPNPFNTSTTIELFIPNNGYIEINVFNSLGKKINQLFSNEMPSGVNKVTFDGQNISSGIYYIQVKYSNIIETKKILLLK